MPVRAYEYEKQLQDASQSLAGMYGVACDFPSPWFVDWSESPKDNVLTELECIDVLRCVEDIKELCNQYGNDAHNDETLAKHVTPEAIRRVVREALCRFVAREYARILQQDGHECPDELPFVCIS